jgi:hypothetical protein
MSVCIGHKLFRRIPLNSGGFLKIQEDSLKLRKNPEK